MGAFRAMTETTATTPTSLNGRPIRRVLFFGKSMSRSRATAGIVEALRGHGLVVRWVRPARLRRWLGVEGAMQRARGIHAAFRPDLVLVFCRDLWSPLLDEFRAAGTPIALWIESPLDHVPREQIEYLAKADAVFMTNPAHFEYLRQHGIRNVSYVMDGVSLTSHHPWRDPWWSPWDESRFRRDIVFVGGPGADGARARFLARLSDEFDVVVHGKGWDEWRRREPGLRIHAPVRARGFRWLCATSRIVLGMNQFNHQPLYFSNRTFMTLACRGFHLTHYVPGLERVFREYEHLAWFGDLDDCKRKIRHFLARPEERERIAANGYEHVRDNHSFMHRIAEVLRVLGGGAPVRGPVANLLEIPRPAVERVRVPDADPARVGS
jgi:hypothetical protein